MQTDKSGWKRTSCFLSHYISCANHDQKKDSEMGQLSVVVSWHLGVQISLHFPVLLGGPWRLGWDRHAVEALSLGVLHAVLDDFVPQPDGRDVSELGRRLARLTRREVPATITRIPDISIFELKQLRIINIRIKCTVGSVHRHHTSCFTLSMVYNGRLITAV